MHIYIYIYYICLICKYIDIEKTKIPRDRFLSPSHRDKNVG